MLDRVLVTWLTAPFPFRHSFRPPSSEFAASNAVDPDRFPNPIEPGMDPAPYPQGFARLALDVCTGEPERTAPKFSCATSREVAHTRTRWMCATLRHA